MALLIVGVLILVAVVAGFFYMQHTKSELHTMIGTETLSIPELEQFRTVSDELGAKGGFRKATEVVGAAHPRPEGPLTASLSHIECVWYHSIVYREYEHVAYRNGKREYSKRMEKVSDYTSGEGFALIDEQGRTIGVDPNGTKPEVSDKTVDRYEPYVDRSAPPELFGFRLPQFLRGDHNDSTIGFKYLEWVIRPGSQLYVLGEVHDRIGPLVIGKPVEKGHFIISTSSEEELRKLRGFRHRALSIGVLAGAAVGLALVVVGALR